jgi:hypothetical protein
MEDKRCTCQWADDVGDPEVGPDPYILEVDRGCPQHGEALEDKPESELKWVNAYNIERCYGGPEEGGWYYDWYECKASCPALGETAAEIVKLIMSKALGWEPSKYEANHGGARFTVNGRGDFACYIEDSEAESQSTERPFYE